MASITFAIDDNLRIETEKFHWVNWSEIAREELIKKNELLKKLESKEEKEITGWSVKIGKDLNKKAFKKLLAKLSPDERKELLGH